MLTPTNQWSLACARLSVSADERKPVGKVKDGGRACNYFRYFQKTVSQCQIFKMWNVEIRCGAQRSVTDLSVDLTCENWPIIGQTKMPLPRLSPTPERLLRNFSQTASCYLELEPSTSKRYLWKLMIRHVKITVCKYKWRSLSWWWWIKSTSIAMTIVCLIKLIINYTRRNICRYFFLLVLPLWRYFS